MAYQDAAARSDLSVLAVIADPTRQTVLELLRRRPLRVGELAEHLPVSRPAVSQHLKILKDANLVREHREGTRHFFSLNPAGFSGIREYVDSMWNDALNAFAAYVSEQTASEKKSRRKGSR
jgi:DNA-binding transcriptional ArsR family regulator